VSPWSDWSTCTPCGDRTATRTRCVCTPPTALRAVPSSAIDSFARVLCACVRVCVCARVRVCARGVHMCVDACVCACVQVARCPGAARRQLPRARGDHHVLAAAVCKGLYSVGVVRVEQLLRRVQPRFAHAHAVAADGRGRWRHVLQ
jgi:hypothetical protein